MSDRAATGTGADAPSLRRVLRALASVGVLTEAPAEYDALFRAAGFRLTRAVPTPPGPGVVEAVPI